MENKTDTRLYHILQGVKHDVQTLIPGNTKITVKKVSEFAKNGSVKTVSKISKYGLRIMDIKTTLL